MTFIANPSSSMLLSPSEQQQLVEKFQVFTIQGRDKHERPLLRIIGKYFPGKAQTHSQKIQKIYSFIFPFFVLYLATTFLVLFLCILFLTLLFEQRGS